MSFRSPYYGQDYNSQRPKLKQVGHFKRMAQVTGKNGPAAKVNEYVSPYSILRTSTENDVDGTIEKITVGSGARTNRAQLLRQLALKQKFDRNPFLARTHKFTKVGALAQGEDPHFNDLNNEYPKLYSDIYPNGMLPHQLEDAVTAGGTTKRVQRARIRNSRGSYDTFDEPAGSTSLQNAFTASNKDSLGRLSNRKKVSEMKKAEQRLRTIEQISKYREEKIKREFMKLEQEMNIENEKQRQQMEKEERMKKYFQRQKDRIEGYRMERHQQDIE